MHGQAKLKSTEAEKEKKRKEREEKVKTYKAGMEQIFLKRSNNENDNGALSIISDLLSANPDIYTLWNFRKEVLLSLKEKMSKEEMNAMLPSELRLTEVCLKLNPKSYGAWYHRLWLMDNMPEPDLNHELELCNKYLKLDERNFHCWDYRRAIVSRLGVTPEAELEFTKTKIIENFSNYSSWHYRSKLLPLVYPDSDGIRPIDEKLHLQELEMVESAAYTDPNDQSGWFYQRWLLGRKDKGVKLVAARATPCSLLLAFSRPLRPSDISVEDFPQPWSTVNFKQASTVLMHEGGVESEKLRVKCFDEMQEISLEKGSWSCEANFHPVLSPNLASVLTDQLASLDQLLDLEPDSKWALLTSALMMQAVDRIKYKQEILGRMEKLIEVDYLRAAYFKDMKSKMLIEYKLEEGGLEICCKDLGLTALYHAQYLLLTEKVDLSGNTIPLAQFYPLQACKVLTLNNCQLTSLKGLPRLQSLKTLSLRDNLLSSLSEVQPYLEVLPNLEILDLSGNPLEISTQLADSFSKLKLIKD